jgi:hypothetical protein
MRIAEGNKMKSYTMSGSRQLNAVRAVVMISGLFLLQGLSFAETYRDKHGNEGTITFGAPIVNEAATGIDYTVLHSVTDSLGTTSGKYVIKSEMLPGRNPSSDDFVLNVFVSDNVTQTAAELIFRNNPSVAPLAPVLRLLDCSTDPCTEDKRYDNAEWGPWIIRDQADIADYPIELLDARVTVHLLDPAQLSQLPNTTDGNGNWAAIMENHRSNFEESLFRADIDNLGEPQSDLLTTRMIAEIDAEVPGSPDDWLIRHYPTIAHGALTFMTDHRALIEDMTTELFNNYVWPLDHTFPFGRMPIWLVDPEHDAEDATPHLLPTHWERVKTGQGALGIPGCWHDFPVDAYTPTLTNGTTNLGQYECTAIATANGFVDRPCTVPSDYTVLGPTVEGAWHDPIHVFIGGSFFSATTTAGTMVFWALHTYASTNTLANWRQAQMRDMPVPFAIFTVEVDIDINPGSDAPNPVNTGSKGLISVAILTTPEFDATQVDDATLAFGPSGAVIAHQQGHIEDVDGDGEDDLVVHFRTQDTGIECGDTEATLTGATLIDGIPISGTDSIHTVGKSCQ